MDFQMKLKPETLEENTTFLQTPDKHNFQAPNFFETFLQFCQQRFLTGREQVYTLHLCKNKTFSHCLKKVDSESVSTTKEKSMYRHCLCDTIYPIIILAHIVGVIPLTLNHPKGKDGGRTGACLMTYRCTSFGSIVNVILILAFTAVLPFSYTQIRDRIGAIFEGTDLYAFTFQTLAILLQTTAVLIAGRINKKKFSKGWEILNEVYHALCDSAGDLSRIKIGSYVLTGIIIVESFCFFFFNFSTYIKSTSVFESCFSIYVGTIYIELSTVIPYILSAVFFFICLLIRSNFLKISAMISTVVAKKQIGKFAGQIDSLRVLHEQLCSAVVYFEDFFGIQVLLTLCICCFTVITGAYAVILQGEDISALNAKEMTAAWGTQLYCAAVFILMILVAGQLVTNSAAASAPVLNAIPLVDLDDQSQKQVTAFLQKLSAFPAKMSAMKITNISTTFLASAATNITTYLLVLMQFKLTIEGKPAASAFNFGTSATASPINISASPTSFAAGLTLNNTNSSALLLT